MADRTGAIVAAAITLPLMLLLIYAAVRNLIGSLRNVRNAVDYRREARRFHHDRPPAQSTDGDEL